MKNFLFKKGITNYKWISIVYLLLRLSVILIMIDQLRNRSYENVFLCILTLLLFLVPSFIERRVHIDIPDTLETIILLFIFSAEILGEINSYYLIFPYWDTILHTLNGFLAAAIGFSLIDILNKNDRFSISLSPVFVALVAFCFSMTIGVVWEFFEFAMDTYFGHDMQKDTYITAFQTVLLNKDGVNIPVHININEVLVNGEPWLAYIDIGLIDTMMDLFVNFIGASVFSVFGYLYIKKRGKSNFLKQFIMSIDSDINTAEDFEADVDHEFVENNEVVDINKVVKDEEFVDSNKVVKDDEFVDSNKVVKDDEFVDSNKVVKDDEVNPN